MGERVTKLLVQEVEERAAEKVSGLSEAKAAREERDAAIRVKRDLERLSID